MLLPTLQFLLEGILGDTTTLRLERIETPKTDIFYLSAPRGELGRLLGRKGRTVDALRDVLGAVGRKLGKDVVIDVIEPRERPSRRS